MVLSTDEIKKEQEEENTTSLIGRPPNPDLQTTQTNDGCLNKNDEHLDVENTSDKTYDSKVEMEKPLDRLIYGENADSKQNCDSQMSKSLPSNSPQNSENEPDKRGREKESQQRDECSESRKLTNFSIDQILRDDFGPKRSRGYYDNDRVRQFPLLSAGAVLSSSSLSSSSSSLSSFYSPLCCPTASRFLSSSGFSAFSSVSKSNFVPKHPTSRFSVEKYYNSPALTPPPSSPESSTSSLSPSSTSRYHASKSSPKKEASSASYVSVTSSTTSSEVKGLGVTSESDSSKQLKWPAWVYCTRYSDRPSSGPRYRKPRQSKSTDKRPRTAFSTTQLQRLRSEFHDCPYLSESRRISLARELGLSESQVKIWFQNKRAKLKKGCGVRNPLAQLLMDEGLYNHSTIVVREDNDDSNKSNNNNNHKSDNINGGGAGSSKSVMVNN